MNRIINQLDFHFRNLVLSAPAPWARRPLQGGVMAQAEIDGHVAAMKRDGITVIPGFVEGGLLQSIKDALDGAYLNERPDVKIEDHTEDGMLIGYVREPLMLHDGFTELAFSPDAINIVQRHLGRLPKLADADLRRAYPVTMEHLREINSTVRNGASACDWHYDNRGRQVKIMLYLTDVGPDDQNFAFCPGTHRGFKGSGSAYSRFSDQWVDDNITDVREIFGSAGDAVVFDTRAIHRLRRKPSRVRDTITFYYHCGYLQTFPRKIPHGCYDRLPEMFRDPLIPA